MAGVLLRDGGGDTDAEERRCEDGGGDESHMAMRMLTALRSWGASRDPALELSEGVQPCQPLPVGLLGSGTVWEYISLLLSLPVCGPLFWSPRRPLARHHQFCLELALVL